MRCALRCWWGALQGLMSTHTVGCLGSIAAGAFHVTKRLASAVFRSRIAWAEGGPKRSTRGRPPRGCQIYY